MQRIFFKKEEWVELSKLTKQDLINGSSYVDRIIHFENSWYEK